MSEEASVPVNSKSYWDRRFSEDWGALGGREQSRTFMDLLVKYLPAALHEEIAAQGWSILDCGCAMGDGTAVLAEAFPRSRVSGFDFSPSAVAAARRAYPGIDFFIADFAGLDREADLLVTSHCLEHLEAPVSALRGLAARARRCLLVLVPYLEPYPPHHEHRRVIHGGTFPEEVAGWRMSHRLILPPVPQWQTHQLLLVYQPAEVVDSVPVAGQRLELAALEVSLSGIRRDLEEATAARVAAEQEASDLRVELESWRWDATSARRELAHLQSSRLWRLASVYWELRRRLGLARKPQRGGNGNAGQAAGPSTLAAPAGDRNTGSAAPPHGQDPDLSRVPPSFPRTPAGRWDVVIFSIIDWDFRFQRPQQIATQLGRHGHRVFYLSPSRTVPPDGPAWTMAWKAKNAVELSLRGLRPLDIYGGRLEEADLAALEEALGDLLQALALGDVVALVQIPFWAPLAARLRERYGWRVVYDCMDEWANFPGFGGDVLALEDGLVRSADLTVATARLLYDKLDGQAARLALVPNGVDLEHYRRYAEAKSPIEEGDRPVTGPVIGYYGALASWVDSVLVEKIALRFPRATLVLAGGAFDVDLSAVESLPNVRLLGQRPYEEMPALLRQFDACIIPFLVNDITEATNPVKLYEYLSGGKPVVSPRLTELLPFEALCYLADGHDDFLAKLEQALAEPPDDPRRDRRRAVAAENDWRERHATLSAAVDETFPLVSIIVVTFGGLPLTRRCLESLLAGETWPRFEILVVDNASPDGTADYLLSLTDPRVRVFLQERNLGFPAANNVGIREARGEIIVLLNNDTVVPPGMIGRIVRPLLRDLSVGLVCPTTNFCGNEARVEPGYEDLSGLPAFAAGRAHEHAGRLLDLSVAAMYCVAARREVVEEVGLLDEAFGIGMFEDDDYSLRVRQAGYRVVCAEDAYIHHVGQGSFRQLSAEEYEALWKRNQAHYERKWGRKWKPHTMRSGVAPVLSKVGLM